MAADESSWRTAAFRQSVVAKIDEAIQRSGMPTSKNSLEMENHVFQKAKTKEEYLGFVARLILHVREMNSKKGATGMGVPGAGGGQAAQDPINALQNLARQGTGNQIMGLGGPQAGGMVQPSSIPASSLLQTLNQRPPQGLPGMQPMQNKMPGDMGLGPGPQVGPPMVGMPGQMQPGPMPNVACPSQMAGQIPNQMRVPMPGQIQGQPMGQIPQMPGQMGGQMQSQMTHMAQLQQQQRKMKVREARVSGNLDTPEGGFDALMQAIVCQDKIGWRKNARHLLVFSTDADFHFAGDGRLAGLVEPNDMKCHVSDDGSYDSTEFDYPSISQINRAAQENNINLIFAVVQKVLDTYKQLSERIKGSSYGKLDADSKNVVNLIEEEYKKIVDSLRLVTTADPEFLNVSISAKCKNGWQNDTASCGGLLQGDEVTFVAHIKVVKCPPTGKLSFQLKPTALEDHVDINLQVSCDCDCEMPGNPTFKARSPKCKEHGDLRCGVCQCDSDRYGDFCQCEKNSLINQNDTTVTCRMSENAPICSDAGICRCGTCSCYEREDPSERYSGHFCECDNFTCMRYRDALCSGPEHGTCVCGECDCRPGWSGEACECPLNKQSCYQPGTNLECSGRGHCECGECKCVESGGVPFTGKYCQECPTCQSQQCAIYSNLVDCTVFKSGPLKYECPEELDFEVQTVDLVEEPEGSDDTVRFCRAQDEDNCYFFFRYEVDGASVEVQRTKVCPEQVDILALVLGVVGGIVLLGLILLVVWKIVMTIHDGREYAKFENESKNAQFNRTGNPLYQNPVIKYTNPTFRD